MTRHFLKKLGEIKSSAACIGILMTAIKAPA